MKFNTEWTFIISLHGFLMILHIALSMLLHRDTSISLPASVKKHEIIIASRFCCYSISFGALRLLVLAKMQGFTRVLFYGFVFTFVESNRIHSVTNLNEVNNKLW